MHFINLIIARNMESILTQIRYTKKAVHKEIGRFHLLTGHEGP